MRWFSWTYLSDVPIEHKCFFVKVVQVFVSFWGKGSPFMKEIHRILEFTKLENSNFEKGFLCTSDTFFFIADKFDSDKNIILKRENLKTKESYVRQILDRIRSNYYLKNVNYIYVTLTIPTRKNLIQYKNSLKHQVGCFWLFPYVYASIKFF